MISPVLSETFIFNNRLKAESTDLHISKGESDKKIGILTNALLEKERDIEFMAKDLER